MNPPDIVDPAERILIVDDDLLSRKLLKVFLTSQGFVTVTAASGEEALNIVARDPPDLILLDVLMPGLDGYQVVAKLKGDPSTKNIPIILVTVLDAREDRMLGLRAGCDEFLSKPFDPAELSARVRNLLRTSKLASMNADLARTQASLKDAVKARDEFLSVASHELRTPLQSLVLQVQTLIRHNKGTVSVFEQLKTIDRQAGRLAALVAQLLDVSRVTGNRLHLESEDMDLVELARDVASRFSLNLQRCGSELRVHSPGPVRGSWDRERIDQVFTNLIDNAIKFGCGGPIDVSIEVHDGWVRVAVADQGIGIDEGSHVRIFQRFERDVSARHFGGLGLGLWISRQIVEASGGSISVASQSGQGSTFMVQLPAVRSSSESVESLMAGAVILSVDDDSDIQEAMKALLIDEGYTVALCGGGNEALNYLRSYSLPSIILLDLMMPEMDGYEFRSRQLADPRLARIPVVVTTGVGAKSLRTADLGGAEVLVKPIECEALLAAVKKHSQSPARPANPTSREPPELRTA